MVKIGHWIGQYSYEKEGYQKMTGFDSTNFEIEITHVNNDIFFGTVQDDLTTGGTDGIGDIKGKITGCKVEFVKQMPIMALLIGKKQIKKIVEKKHRNIYYSGIFSNDKESISGHWRFKFGFIWVGFFPIPIIPAKGYWKMTLKK